MEGLQRQVDHLNAQLSECRTEKAAERERLTADIKVAGGRRGGGVGGVWVGGRLGGWRGD